jgi:large subunit ribosomal protein L23
MNQEKMMHVLLSPCQTEKSTTVAENNQYVFRVMKNATKHEIKEAAEKLFNVKVQSVRVLNVKPQKVRFSKIQGTHKAWKKAYIRIEPGNTIEFLETKA